MTVILAVGVGAVACGDDEPEERPGELLTPEECIARGGEAIGDPGDGSTHREGCPDGREQLGSLEFGDEGGICCKR
ncbi:hypothetical protein HPC49_02230 [Pyxidicoccus fallax]|uniref:Uncharacterized protein n=1 Tax=Pyxidicoccus fallax TaxID=394095 RepID=A0A848L8H7_9BACT|nr:hypothetical protein [Pyxidicoccus fallax]NMO14552.1 hypothetical protein [Pyxidicoccus fallax]NPC77071.1 hypothetical protein [Pyxidicoccus fallax]